MPALLFPLSVVPALLRGLFLARWWLLTSPLPGPSPSARASHERVGQRRRKKQKRKRPSLSPSLRCLQTGRKRQQLWGASLQWPSLPSWRKLLLPVVVTTINLLSTLLSTLPSNQSISLLSTLLSNQSINLLSNQSIILLSTLSSNQSSNLPSNLMLQGQPCSCFLERPSTCNRQPRLRQLQQQGEAVTRWSISS